METAILQKYTMYSWKRSLGSLYCFFKGFIYEHNVEKISTAGRIYKQTRKTAYP